MPAKQAWIQSLHMIWHDLRTSTTGVASLMAEAIFMSNTTGTLGGNIREYITRYICMHNNESQLGMHKHSRGSYSYTQTGL